MTTASTSTAFNQTNNAGFNAWVQEIYTNLVTNCGLTQLSASQDTAQLAVPAAFAGSLTINTASGYYMFTFNDTLGQGPLVTGTALSALTAGTGYNGGSSGTFTGVNLSGGTGSGAKATVVLGASGVITSITPTTAGTGYNLGDQLIVTSANMVSAGAAAGGGSSGFAFVQQLTSAAAPILIKLEFGSSSATTQPQMWISIGTSWTSNGTLGAAQIGAVIARVAVNCASAIGNVSTPYTSRFCYNASLSFLGLVFKTGGYGTTNCSYGGFFVYRTSNAGGSATNNAICLITNSISSTGSSGNYSAQQCMSCTANAVYPALTTAATIGWLSVGYGYNSGNSTPYNVSTTLEGGFVFVFPTLTIDPGFRLSAVVGLVMPADIPVGNTFSAAIIGSTPITFLSVGLPFGVTGLGYVGQVTATYASVVMPWQ